VSHGGAKVLAAALVGAISLSVATASALLLIGLIRGHIGDIPAVVQKMAEVLEGTRLWLEERGGASLIPSALSDAEHLKRAFSDWLRAHAVELRKTGGEMGRGVLHAGIGMAIGLLIFFRHSSVSTESPLTQALTERVRRLAEAFETVVFAQVKISAVNAALTALYLFLALPFFGVHLPFSSTLVAVTFLTGLLPVVGNLLSNTVIVVISLGVSGWAAAASLAFLIVIHKLEYFINARIVGAQIQAAAWEILLAIFAFEVAFGVSGVILAPIVYGYAKKELIDRKLV
jgi:predicted PurR-regulated permease PerM